MKSERKSGLLLHPSSLPGDYGIGTLGSQAYRFIDFLHNSKQGIWQILPLGPTGYGYSPYQCLSAFAGNPLLLDPDQLRSDGLISDQFLSDLRIPNTGKVDYELVGRNNAKMLQEAYKNFKNVTGETRKAYENFKENNLFWLRDYSLFRTLKDIHNSSPWYEWGKAERLRDEAALNTIEHQYPEEYEFHIFLQYCFYTQWQQLHRYANEKNIAILGDMPIFVAHDSADVWAHPELFYLKETGEPVAIAGVPPDYFSSTGQRWGNPLYRWDVLKKTGYSWWIDRLREIGSVCDLIRIDHFRGFEKYWEIPAESETAINGKWVEGPGEHFFETILNNLPELKILAEDLGIITPEVEQLRDRFGFPGMKILQFAFGGGSGNPYLPHNFVSNCIVYTGTHDNNTTQGWLDNDVVDPQIRTQIIEYLDSGPQDIVWKLIRTAMQSVAKFCIFPVQDLLCLNSSARMNFPGTTEGNWQWRLLSFDKLNQTQKLFTNLTELYGRG